jgi:hypothetical protein
MIELTKQKGYKMHIIFALLINRKTPTINTNPVLLSLKLKGVEAKPMHVLSP